MRGKTLGAGIKLLIFAVVTVFATIILAIVISNRTFGSTYTYHAMFSDVTNLISGNDVRLAGVRVGTVKSIHLQPDNLAEVTFTVDKSVPISTTTDFEVRYLNLIGQRYVAVVEKPGNGVTQPRNQTIPVNRTAPAVDLTALFNGFKPLFHALSPHDVNTFALELIKTLQGEGGTVQSLLAQTASLTNTVAKRDAVVGQVIDNLVSVLTTVQHRNAGLNETIDQLQRLVTGLAGDRNTIAASLSNIDHLATSSTELLSGIRPYLPSDLKSLGALAKNLNTTKDSDGQNSLVGFLEREPAKLDRITRTATYGGFFNFWACQLSIAGAPAAVQPSPSQAPSCPGNSG
jgi:phospholipid/cholesterol/gamma-HCH transport system substrate-binding protein